MKTLYIFYFFVASACAKSCVHEWRSYHGTGEPMVYGVFVGNYNTGIPAFIGRGSYDDLRVTGRIQMSDPKGMYHVSGGSIHRITGGLEYLVKNPNYDYKWIPSANGEYVEDAISPGYTPGREVHYVGRIKVDGRTFYGKMIPNVGMYYEDGNQKQALTSKYELIICTVPSK
ncbi:uncharacterized protein [Chironomus tepperi]|uniref:uncharacterized protein n=1 Tax=Chironomus tepperi TaxID=113505 RepID=UPI00391FA86D